MEYINRPEIHTPYDARNLVRLIDKFFDAFGPEALRDPRLDRKYEHSIRLEREDNPFSHYCPNTGQAHLTRPIPEYAEAAEEAWSQFGGHRVTFYDSSSLDGSAMTTDYFIKAGRVMKRQLESIPEDANRLNSPHSTRFTDSLHVATEGLLRRVEGERRYPALAVDQNELENLLSWMGGAAPTE